MTQDSYEKKHVLNLYAAFGVSLLVSLVPSVIVALISLAFIIGVLGAAYVLRKRAAPESLMENHALYIIRTIWIATALSLVTLAAGSAYMLPNIDYSAFGTCAAGLAQKGQDYAQTAGFMEIYVAAEPCMKPFLDMNLRLFIITALIAALPVVLYFVIRFVRGLSRAVKGYRIANPKGWI